MVTTLATNLAPADYDRAAKAAALPDMVRGYEDIKLANVELYRNGLHDLGIEPPQL